MAAIDESYRMIPLFENLEDEDIGSIIELTHLVRYSQGEVIMQQGEESTSMFLLEKGSVEVSREYGGKNKQFNTVHAKAILGEMALISNSPRTATVKAKTDVELRELDANSFQYLKDSDRYLAYKVVESIALVLSRRVVALNDKMSEIDV